MKLKVPAAILCNKLLLWIFWGILVSCEPSDTPPSCSSYEIDSNVLEVDLPTPNPRSAIGQVFESLEGRLQAVLVPQPSGPSCYEWTCQSAARKGESCRWCLPSIFVGGIAKCGTTALCDKLVTHPDVRFYGAKETDIFTKMRFSISNLEKKINNDFSNNTNSNTLNTTTSEKGHDNDTYSNRSLRKGKHRNNKGPQSPSRHVGDVWLDCSAGAFRDFNAAAYLRKYSPDTKVVLIVRDPWQTIGSRMSQQKRNGGSGRSMLAYIRGQFHRLQYPAKTRFSSKALLHLAKTTDYAYGENLLYWRAAFPSSKSLLLLDQYDLQHHPQETMFRLEAFLNIPHVNYSHDVLQAVSHNTNLKNSKDNSSTSSDDLLIREPYSFTHDKEFQKLSRNVLHPSLCLFEKAFGWKIHITTKSEI